MLRSAARPSTKAGMVSDSINALAAREVSRVADHDKG